MVVTLSVPDSIFQAYAAMGDKPAQTIMVKQLEKFQKFNPLDRVLIFPTEERQAMERLYGQPIEDFKDFIRWLTERAGVKVDEAQLDLSEGQRRRLVSEAKFYEETYENYLKKRAQRALDGAI